MKNKTKFPIRFLTLGLILVPILINIIGYSFNTKINDTNLERDDITNLKSSVIWDLTGTPILIDGNAEWATTATTEPWCSGTGTWNDPYLIEYVIIDGQGSGNPIEIRNSDVFFIIRNSTLLNSGSGAQNTGILLYRTDNGQLINNTCNSNNQSINGPYGIYLDDSKNNTILDNYVKENGKGIGLYRSDYNSILFNIVKNNDKGMYLELSENNNIFSNTLTNNINYGIYFQSGNYNNIIGNIGTQNTIEIYFNGATNNTISKNILKVATPGMGIQLNAGINNIISENKINGSGFNSVSGIYIYSGDHNVILRNEVSFLDIGIKIEGYDNLLSQNHIVNNSKGIFLNGGFSNILSKNYFLGNTIHAIDDPTDLVWVNNWNNTVLGNYWDNHSTGDANGDGIDDTPYNIPGIAGSIDYLPIFGDPFILPNTIHIDGTGVSAPNWNWAATRDWVKGSGTSEDPFIIEDLTLNAGEEADAILIGNSSVFFIIKNCTILNFTNTGIKLNKTNNGQLINNTCTNIFFVYGIYLDSSNSTIISNNNINDFSYGIRLENSSHNSIIENSANGNSQAGIALLTKSNFNNIANNTVTNNNYGIVLQGSYHNDILKNEIEDNIYDGIRLEFGGSNSIYENKVIYNEQGIRIYHSTLENIYNNTINNNDYGIYITNGDESKILGNEIDQNDYGLLLERETPGQENNLISKNLFSNCNIWGLKITSSSNLIYLNNFTGTPLHAVDDKSNNQWDNGSIGNYWDDYPGADANDDGIGDIPYNITGLAGSQDSFPIWADGDDILPTITLNSPPGGAGFGINAPIFNLNIFDLNLNMGWYKINSNATKYSFPVINGVNLITINQLAWEALSEGNVIIIFYVNDTAGNTNNLTATIDRLEGILPTITLNSPLGGAVFGGNPPTFNLNIYDLNLNMGWYTINDNATKYSFPVINGVNLITINHLAWEGIAEGGVIIRFYVNDTAGNTNNLAVSILKELPSDELAIPFGNFYLIIISISVIILIRIRIHSVSHK